MCPQTHQWQMLLLAIGLWTSGCTSLPGDAANADRFPFAVTRVAFAPDGRLLRVRATAHEVSADVSRDNGAHFGSAVTVSKPGQQIVARRDDPPALAVDSGGRISVVYYAAERRKAAAYISYAAPDDLRFSEPVVLAAPSQMDEYGMVRLAAAPDGRSWLFWYATQQQASSGSLYYSSAAPGEKLQAPHTKLFDAMCACCRPALDFDTHGDPVLFARMMFANGTRDHALLRIHPPLVQRAVVDDWHIDACPMQGPALSIDANNRYHAVWFTQGEKRQGLYYAWSDDRGRTFSPPVVVGNAAANARQAAVIARADRVVIAWQESDATTTQLRVMQSADRGRTWREPQGIAQMAGAVDHPQLIAGGNRIFLSWSSKAEGHRMLPLPPSP